MQHPSVDHKEAIVWSYRILDLPELERNETPEALELKLANYLNDLIVNDFNKLIGILYRIDISQEKAVAALAESVDKETGGETLARLIIDRQKEKIYYRKLYSK